MGIYIQGKEFAGAIIGGKKMAGAAQEGEIIYKLDTSVLSAASVNVNIRDITSTTVTNAVTLTADITGTFDDIETVTWSITTGSGTLTPIASTSTTSRQATYTPDAADSGTDIVISLTIGVDGTGSNARAGTTATDTDTETFSVIGAASAPTVSVQNLVTVPDNAAVTITATISGGVYDTISYAWSVVSGGGSITGNGLTATYTPPDVDGNTLVLVRLTVTVTGTGTMAINNTSDTATANDVFIVTDHIPDASAPTATITSISSVSELMTAVPLEVTVSGGVYDTISYSWEVVSGGGTITGSGTAVSYAPPDVTADTDVTVRVTVGVTGTGTNAASGSSDETTDTEVFTVNFIASQFKLPAGTYAGFTFRTSTASLCVYDTTNEVIVRRTRGGVAQTNVTLSSIPSGATYTDLSTDSAGQFHMWREVSSGNAIVDIYSSTGTFMSTVTMDDTGGPNMSLDFESGDYVSMDGTTLRIWNSSGTGEHDFVLTGVSEQDVIIDDISGVDNHAWFVTDGRRVSLNNGFIDTGMSSDWPDPTESATTWDHGKEDPTAGGAIWLYRSDGLIYRVGSGETPQTTTSPGAAIYNTFVDGGFTALHGRFTDRGLINNDIYFYDPDQITITSKTVGVEISTNEPDGQPVAPNRIRMRRSGGSEGRITFGFGSGDVNVANWLYAETRYLYLVTIGTNDDSSHEWVRVSVNNVTSAGALGGSTWLNLYRGINTNDLPIHGDNLNIREDLIAGNIDGTAQTAGVPAAIAFKDWVEERFRLEVGQAPVEFIFAIGGVSTIDPNA